MKLKLRLVMPLLVLFLGLSACKSTVPVDAVMDRGDVFFVLESPEAVSSIRVLRVKPEEGRPRLMWELRHNMTVPLRERKFPRLKQLRYGQAIVELPVTSGPLALGRGEEYVVIIEIGKTFAQDSFIITKDDKLLMPAPAFARQQGRAYSVITDKEGNKEFVLGKQ